ncbi:unnamed protein product [Macrosiphum euphorbiae]|uniref:Uncharacterized protein n=1 Tax=Macrosiphum euphorbiae TaxID=13131 RepID=A0AAV0VQX3_9HEMI|nr:unnamed protein product [Macrosiphum euphorbiae]
MSVSLSSVTNQQPSATTSTLTEDLQVEADRRSLNLPPLSLCPNDEQSVGSLQECEFHIHSDCNYSSKSNAYTVYRPRGKKLYVLSVSSVTKN